MEVLNNIKLYLSNQEELQKKADSLFQSKNIRGLQWKTCWLNEQNEKWCIRFGYDTLLKDIDAIPYMKSRHTILHSMNHNTTTTTSSSLSPLSASPSSGATTASTHLNNKKHFQSIALPLVSWLVEMSFDYNQKNSFNLQEYTTFLKMTLQYFYDAFSNELEKISTRECLISLAKKSHFEKDYDIMIDKKTNNVIELGRGQYGAVFQVKCKRSNKICCMKRIWKNKLDKKEGIEVDIQSSIIEEVMIIRGLDHPKIVKLLGWYVEEDCHVLVMEFVRGKTLLNIILERLSQKKSFSEVETRKVITSILHASAYFHHKGIIHRDLKPDNIMIPYSNQSTTEYDFDNLKLIDFGLAAKLRDYAHTSKAGTPYYMAPEVFLGNYSYKCDIWSIGVIMYMMLSAHLPLVKSEGSSTAINTEKKKKKRECPFKYFDTRTKLFPESQFQHISNEAKDLLYLLLNLEADKRPCSKTALLFPWVHMSNNTTGSGSGSVTLNSLNGHSAAGSSVGNIDSIFSPLLYQQQWEMQSILDHQMIPKKLLSKISKKGSTLLSYCQLPIFEQQCLQLVATHLSTYDINDINNLFLAIDIHHCGYLSKSDLFTALSQNHSHSYLINKQLLRLIIDSLDYQKNDAIGYTTFVSSFLCNLMTQNIGNEIMMSNENVFAGDEKITNEHIKFYQEKLYEINIHNHGQNNTHNPPTGNTVHNSHHTNTEYWNNKIKSINYCSQFIFSLLMNENKTLCLSQIPFINNNCDRDLILSANNFFYKIIERKSNGNTPSLSNPSSSSTNPLVINSSNSNPTQCKTSIANNHNVQTYVIRLIDFQVQFLDSFYHTILYEHQNMMLSEKTAYAITPHQNVNTGSTTIDSL